MNLEIAEVYKEVFLGNQKEVWLKSGRNAGKSKVVSQFALYHMLKAERRDGIINRATLGALSTSSFNEVASTFVETLDKKTLNRFTFKKNPLRIIRDDGATIYFFGIGGDDNRTRSTKTLNPVAFIINEEVQELRDYNEYNQAMTSYRRNLANDDFKIINLFNPPAIKLHWVNVHYEECKRDKSILCIHSSYLDVLKYLKDFDIRTIRKEMIMNPANYEWMYLGATTNGQGLVYPMFKEEKIISEREFSMLLPAGLKVVACVIGVDGAVTRDETVCCPLLILSSGQAVVGDLFIQDPVQNGIIGSHVLVERYITKRFEDLQNKYHLGGSMYMQDVPCYIRCDSAAADLVQELQFFLGNRADVGAIHKSSIIDMVGNVQSCMSNDMFYIVDPCQFKNYYQNKIIQTRVNPLVEQIEALAWNEKQTGYDPSIPNDRTDAMTYAVRFYYGNIENISYFNILLNQNRKVLKVKDVIGR